MKAPSTHWQDVTHPVCSEYEELFQQSVSILDALRLSNQQAQQNKRVPLQNLVFRWRIGVLRWKSENAHEAMRSHGQRCATCRKKWEAVLEEMLRGGESDSVMESTV